MKKQARPHILPLGSILFCLGLASAPFAGAAPAANPAPAPGCPTLGWEEGLAQYLAPNAAFPVNDTANLPTPDCAFHEWSWEAFVWATALVTDPGTGTVVPRFLTLPTSEDLLSPGANAGQLHLRPLKLAARSRVFLGDAAFTEGAGAIVEASGGMMVAPNGYPVYASVHMNPSYFATAKQNLIVNQGYTTQPAGSFFSVGAAVFKATWLRLAPGQTPPAGAYTTQAQVPVLATHAIPGNVTIAPVPGQFTTVTVALVGLHVVGYTVNHQEFLWGTFEHRLNSPATDDNTYPGPGVSANTYTFYQANTPYSQANNAVFPPALRLNAATQQLTPVTAAVQENRTGGENQPNGPGNIDEVTASAQSFLVGLKDDQSAFASYKLDGTVWMLPNSYSLTSNQGSAVGSVNLANVTGETFVQTATNTPVSSTTNCFLCHNPTSYSFQTPPPAVLPNRLIALSHVLAIGTPYAVPNQVSGTVGPIDQLRGAK